MANDNKVIGYLAPADMVALMGETGMITVQESATVGDQPVIHAALKVISAQTGEQLPGGLPFTVIMFKTPREPGYSNIAIGAVVPTTEMGVMLPRDYFNFSNQHYRFARVFPLDDRAFVIQMDLFLRNATREYVKFSFGIWAALFSQVLFDLIGKGGQGLHAAAEAYVRARTDLSQQFVSTVVAADEPAAVETALAESVANEAAAAEPVTEFLPAHPISEAHVETIELNEFEEADESATEVTAEQHDATDSEAEPLPPKIDAVSDGHGDVATAEHTGSSKIEAAVEPPKAAEAGTEVAAADAAETAVKPEAA